MNKENELEQLIEKSKEVGKLTEQIRIVKMLQDYFELTQEPDEKGNVTDNPEWDRGYQAAIAIIKGASQ